CENKMQDYLDVVYPVVNYDDYQNYQNSYLSILSEYKVGYIDKEYSKEMISGNSIDVLCINLLAEYKDNINNREYILANNLLINISYYQFVNLSKKELIVYDKENDVYVCSIEYSEEIGLKINQNQSQII
ncbi:MAG: hypothetical protein WCX96_05115, partial [Bacilli bacterium]